MLQWSSILRLNSLNHGYASACLQKCIESDGQNSDYPWDTDIFFTGKSKKSPALRPTLPPTGLELGIIWEAQEFDVERGVLSPLAM